MIGIFHIHTSYSFDTYLPPKKIADCLQEMDIDFVAITDHETIQGALEVKEILSNQSPPIQIIVGAEYYTEKGDIMGLFLEEEIKTQSSDEVINEIKKQGGLVVLPHPYKAHKLDQTLIQSVDVIEVYNSRTTRAKNAQALALAKEYNKPGIIGSDAHFIQEVGLTMMEFDTVDLKSAILAGQGKIIRAEESQFYYSIVSGLINLHKTKDLHLIQSPLQAPLFFQQFQKKTLVVL